MLIAAALVITTTGYAVAQNTGSPSNPARPGLQGDDSSKPNGLQNNAGTGVPAKAGEPMAAPTTSGTSGAMGGNARSTDTNVSPASPVQASSSPRSNSSPF